MQKTYFAPAERASAARLKSEISAVSHNPIIDTLLLAVHGLLAVLNEKRQVLAVNDTLLAMLGITDPGEILGLRPGQVLHCIHAEQRPHGCGTTPYCMSCGAVIAMMASLTSNQPVEKKCALTTQRNGRRKDFCLTVRAAPLTLEKRRFLLLFLQDITSSELQAGFQRSFFHDLNNIITALVSAGELLAMRCGDAQELLVSQLQRLIKRLNNEVALQRALISEESLRHHPEFSPCAIGDLVADLEQLFINHPASRHKHLVFPKPLPTPELYTDGALLLRVLTNMLLNAFEASEADDRVVFDIADQGREVVFSVWNRKPIPAPHQLRIFQRHFSTKDGAGHGIGTFAMKLIGEELLGGRVSFNSAPETGTTFSISIATVSH